MGNPQTSGVVYLHAVPIVAQSHIEWALRAVFGRAVDLMWNPQPAGAGESCAVLRWRGPQGTAARIAKALSGWPVIRFEITENPSEGVDGRRFAHVPGLGMWQGRMDPIGSTVIGEDLLRSAMAAAIDLEDIQRRLDRALGTPWLEDLESYYAGAAGVAMVESVAHVG